MTQLSAPTSSSPGSPGQPNAIPCRSGMRLPRWIIPAVVVVGALFFLGSILLPSGCKSRETANRIKCAANLRQIGNALMLFAKEHDGKFPDQLSELIATEDLTPSGLVCPSGTADASTASSPTQLAADLLDKRYSSYIYIRQNLGNPDKAIVVESVKDHDEDGICVLFGDYHAEFMQYRKGRPEMLATLGIPDDIMKVIVEQ